MLCTVRCVDLDRITFNMLKGLFKAFIYAKNNCFGFCVHSLKHREINNFSRVCDALIGLWCIMFGKIFS